MRINFLLLLFFMLCHGGVLLAHGDLHARITAITKTIDSYPDSAELYQKRGELYIQHEEPLKAITDFDKCQALGFHNKKLTYNRSKAYFNLSEYARAQNEIKRLLNQYPEHVRGHRLAGDIYFAEDNYLQSADHYEKVIQHAIETIPENYQEASVAYEKINTLESIERAIEIIKTGQVKFGELPIFYNRLIDLYTASENYDAILELQTKKISKAGRKEFALFERAKTYIQLRAFDDADQDLEAALMQINHLPRRIQNLSVTRQLKKDITTSLESLEHE